MLHGNKEKNAFRNSPNPIMLDTAYTAAGSLTGNLLPAMKDVVLWWANRKRARSLPALPLFAPFPK